MTQKHNNMNFVKPYIWCYTKIALLVASLTACITLALIPLRTYIGGAWELWLTNVHDTQLTWYCVAACVLTIAFIYMESKRNKQ